MNTRAVQATTVFPSRAGDFPAVTYFELPDALHYAMSFAPLYAAHTCPAASFGKHRPR